MTPPPLLLVSPVLFGQTPSPQLLVATYSSNHASLALASARQPLSASSHSCHNCSRHAANMSANVGVGLSRYHGRCRCAFGPCRPAIAYQHTTREPTNHAIGPARSTDAAHHTCGSWKPSNCLASQKATSTLHRRQYPVMTSTAGSVTSVQTNASSRHCPAGSCTSTTCTACGPAVAYQQTPVTTLMANSRSTPLLKLIVSFRDGQCRSSANISRGVGNRRPCCFRPCGSDNTSNNAAFQWIGPRASTLAGRSRRRCRPMYALSPITRICRCGSHPASTATISAASWLLVRCSFFGLFPCFW